MIPYEHDTCGLPGVLEVFGEAGPSSCGLLPMLVLVILLSCTIVLDLIWAECGSLAAQVTAVYWFLYKLYI